MTGSIQLGAMASINKRRKNRRYSRATEFLQKDRPSLVPQKAVSDVRDSPSLE
jgi:hypothetical protein